LKNAQRRSELSQLDSLATAVGYAADSFTAHFIAAVLRHRLPLSAAERAEPSARNALTARTNYFIGSDLAQWLRNILLYANSSTKIYTPGVPWAICRHQQEPPTPCAHRTKRVTGVYFRLERLNCGA
jgi:hypothetical protein